MAPFLPLPPALVVWLVHAFRSTWVVCYGKLLWCLSFNYTSFLSSSIGSKGKKKSVDSQLCVWEVWVHGGHPAASRLPIPCLICVICSGQPVWPHCWSRMHGSWPRWLLSICLRFNTYLLGETFFSFCQVIVSV